MFHVYKKKEKVMEFFFYNDDIERCVKGIRQKWIQSRVDIPSIWPVKIGTTSQKKKSLI
jgi:Ulp1 family protease